MVERKQKVFRAQKQKPLDLMIWPVQAGIVSRIYTVDALLGR